MRYLSLLKVRWLQIYLWWIHCEAMAMAMAMDMAMLICGITYVIYHSYVT